MLIESSPRKVLLRSVKYKRPVNRNVCSKFCLFSSNHIDRLIKNSQRICFLCIKPKGS